MPKSAPQAGLPQTAMSRGQLLPHWLQRQWRLFLRSLSCLLYTSIRLGTAGATQEHIRLGDIILSQGVSTTSAINDLSLIHI